MEPAAQYRNDSEGKHDHSRDEEDARHRDDPPGGMKGDGHRQETASGDDECHWASQREAPEALFQGLTEAGGWMRSHSV